MEEFIDILNENGVATGEVASRKEIHKKGLWHRAILVAIVDKSNKVLLQQRSKNKEKYPNKWDISVAGHVSSGMLSINAAYAEVMEEVGYQIPKEISVSDFKFITSFKDSRKISDDFIENQFYDLFVLKLDIELKNLEIQLEEVQKIEFVSPFKIKEMNESKQMHPRDVWIKPVYDYISKSF